MTGPSIQSTTGPSTKGPLISDASLVPTIPMISTGIFFASSVHTSTTNFFVFPRTAFGQSGERQFNANIRLVARGTIDSMSSPKRPLVAVGYGPRCVPVMQLTEAAASVCDLLWLIDGSLPEMHQMTDLLNRFGPVVDIHGLGVDEILESLSSPFAPDGWQVQVRGHRLLHQEPAGDACAQRG